MTGVGGPFAGMLSDRYGHKIPILAGVLMVSTGYLLASRVTSVWQLYLVCGLLIGTGVSALLIPIMSTAAKWFGRKSALTNGIILSGFSFAQVVVPPAATYIMLQSGWRTAFVALGLTTLVVGLIGSRFIKAPPQTADPRRVEPQKAMSPLTSQPSPAQRSYSLMEALRTPTLWVFLLIQFIVAACFQMVAIHVVPAATDVGITAEAAAFILTLTGITNTSGRLVLTGLANRVGNKVVLTACLITQALTLFLLARANNLTSYYVLAVVLGLAYGGVTPIVFTILGSSYGTKAVGSFLGIANFFYTMGGATGPYVGGRIFDIFGDYYAAFSFAGIALTVTLILYLLVMRLEARR